MSITGMVTRAAQRELQDTASDSALESLPGADAGDGAKAVDSAMEKITAFIPSEVIGIYIAGLGVINPQSDRGKWIIFAVAAILIPIFMALAHLTKRKQGLPLPAWPTLAILLVFALVAFVAWAAAMPSTPFLAFSDQATVIGGWTVVIFAAIMYKVADLLGVVPKA